MKKVRLETTKGVITIELDETAAPATVGNFVEYVESGFYDDTIFHRVIPGFMVQGGGMTADMKEKATRPAIQNEADNRLKNLRGAIAMARTNDPHSATAQFFINLVDNRFLDFASKTAQGWGYCVFGRVTEGMETVDAMATVQTGRHGYHEDVPAKPIVITKASMVDEAPEA